MSIYVGFDLVAVSDVARAVAAHGDRYLQRIYTDVERTESAESIRRLAVRFAAKEAAMKALAASGGLGWKSIELIDGGRSGPSLQLHGGAAALARQRGVCSTRVSVALGRDHVAAIVTTRGTG